MPLTEVTATDVAHVCSACRSTRRTTLSALKEGQAALAPLAQSPDVLRLPPCECGATEFLVRSPEGEPPHPVPGGLGHLHRLLVDHLHSVLAGTPAPSAELAQWFPDGLSLPVEPLASSINPAAAVGGGQ